MPIAGFDHLKAIAALWWAGCWEALQLQRCIVFCVLDRSGKLLSKLAACILLNGVVYLGSIAAHTYLLQPLVTWLLDSHVTPAMGPALPAAWQAMLRVLFHAVWLAPAYVVSMGVSCIWYTQIAGLAFEVHQQQKQQQQLKADVGAVTQPAAAVATAPSRQFSISGGGGGSALAAARDGSGAGGCAAAGNAPPPNPLAGAPSSLQGVAQELYRMLFFFVFYAEVAAIALLPYVGIALNVVFLSWLYAYYCYDYKWGLQGIRLPERLDFVERRWAFFAGFGFPCVACTAFLPFYVGAGVCNLLFPLFILVACDSDPVAQYAAAAGAVHLKPVRIFHLAQWPTDRIIRRAFGGSGSSSGGGAHMPAGVKVQ